VSASKVLHAIASVQNDSWYSSNAIDLSKLVRKGLLTEDHNLHDALHPIFDRLIRLYPLPKDEDDQQTELAEFHAFVYSAISEGLKNGTSLRGVLLMLKSVVEVIPDRVAPFCAALVKVMNKLTKDVINIAPTNPERPDPAVRLLITVLDICQMSVAFFGDQRRWFLGGLVVLVEKARHATVTRYLLDMAKSWAMVKRDPYPTMKEKSTYLRGMVAFETRGDALWNSYLELIYEIYTEPSLRRGDLTSRLEGAFLLGCRAKDSSLRNRFMDLFDASVPRSVFGRLAYISGGQNWEQISDKNWIYIALYLVLGSTDIDSSSEFDMKGISPAPPNRPASPGIFRSMQRLLYHDPAAAHETWISIFPAVWKGLSRREQTELTHHLTSLFSKDYLTRQNDQRPNIVQTLLTSILPCSPSMSLPPHMLKYLAKTYNAWHPVIELLSISLDSVKEDEATVRDYIFDSLADIYAELSEEDAFYGLWRRRCLHQETNIAIAYEQNGMWDLAASAYENAQSKSRAGSIPFSEAEYCLWEDHWILSAEKLQLWDVLHELARSESNQELALECAWRTGGWVDNKESLIAQVQGLPEVATPRKRVFEAFLQLLQMPAATDKSQSPEVVKILEDAIQLTLRKWIGLPEYLSAAHVPLLQHFQQFVELQEAIPIFRSLSDTTAATLEKKSGELKIVLQCWRERLPTVHDDINVWSDLISWRQNVFQAINATYIPLITPGANSSGASSSGSNTFGYRGYHETAWIINRFAHVARKHDLLDVCFTQLAKIYTLPNIEISEAFLKLREQARCYYQKPNELQAGLEVINNTNLVYFSISQKAEFYTLKGMFHARLGRNEEANNSFGQAVQMDMNQGKAWKEWGRYSDKMFKEHPNDFSYATNAISCYLQAAGLYKNAKARPLLGRVLWLLSIDDAKLSIGRAFDTYKGDNCLWFWVPYIPQLASSLAYTEIKQYRHVLLQIAKHFPQVCLLLSQYLSVNR
jgi:transformation/transcription domain-associated protein